MKMLRRIPRFLLFTLCGLLGAVAIAFSSLTLLPPAAASAVYPSDANLVNVRDYGATGDGQTDDTAAIRQAIEANLNQHRTLLFPAGTYLISDSLEWKTADGVFYAFLTWQGEGAGKTVIRLQDRAPGFSDPSQPKPMIRTGSIESRGDGSGNRAHNNYLFDMTFHTGTGNPGAIGVDFTANNTGAIEHVEILSGDGTGAVGLNLTREVGPCLIKHVKVQGFDTGILVRSALYSITLEQIQLENQRVVGIRNVDNVIAVRKLSSQNQVPALINEGDWQGPAVLIDSSLKGGGAAAIENSSTLLVRNVDVSGYQTAIASQTDRIAEPHIAEYVSAPGVRLFQSPLSTLNLPAAETPEFLDTNLSHWANVEAYGAVRDDDQDDSEGIQRAIDSGKTTLYFPFGSYRLDQPVIVRNQVRRIIGFHSSFASANHPLFQFEHQQHPVILERFNFFNGGVLDNRSTAPVVVRHAISPGLSTAGQPTTWFLENVAAAPIKITRQQQLYARQLNAELPPPEPMITNEGGQVWLLGYKTEFGNTIAATTAGGKTEILGGLFYPAQGVEDSEIPLIVNENASVSATYREISFGSTYTIHVQETQQQQTAVLPREQLGTGAAVQVPLYVGRSDSEWVETDRFRSTDSS